MPASPFPSRTTRSDGLAQDGAIPLEKGLPAAEVDRRLVALTRVHRRVEAALCFYLREVDQRRLYLRFGHASTIDYARERLGFEDRKTRTFLFVAERCRSLPQLGEALRRGDLPWTKARELVRIAQPETEQQWLDKCQALSNRQLESEVRKALPPVRKKTLILVLEGDLLETWEQAREATERLAGKVLSDIEVLDLMCAEVLSAYALTPPRGPEHAESAPDDAYEKLRWLVLERDGWKCTRPGCRCRSGLEVNHIIPRGRGGPDVASNLHSVCAVCHAAITTNRLKVSGRAPDGLRWEGPFGIIEKPLPLVEPSRVEASASMVSAAFPVGGRGPEDHS